MYRICDAYLVILRSACHDRNVASVPFFKTFHSNDPLTLNENRFVFLSQSYSLTIIPSIVCEEPTERNHEWKVLECVNTERLRAQIERKRERERARKAALRSIHNTLNIRYCAQTLTGTGILYHEDSPMSVQ